MKFIFSFAFFFVCNILFAQDYHIHKLTIDGGLSQASNYFRFEDSEGYMWLSGNDAVNRYDGRHVKVYNLNSYFINCPPLQQAYNFVEGENKSIYMGSSLGLYRYDRILDKMSLISIYQSKHEAIPFAYYQDKIWCIDKNFQLATYHVKTKEIKKLCLLGPVPLPSIHIYDLAGNDFYSRLPVIDSMGQVWSPDVKGVWKYNIQTLKSQFFPIPLNIKINSANWNATYSCFMLYNSKEIIRFDTREQKYEGVNFPLEPTSIFSHIVSKSDRIAITTRFPDRIFYGTMKDFPNKLKRLKSDLKSYKINRLSWDREGKLWQSEDGIGQIIYDFKGPRIKKYPVEYDDKLQNVGNGVSSIAEFSNGEVFIQEYYAIFKNHNWFRQYPNKNLYLRNTLNPYSGQLIGYYCQNGQLSKGIGIWNLKGGFETKWVDKNNHYGLIQHVLPINSTTLLCACAQGLVWLKNFKPLPISKQPSRSAFYISSLKGKKALVSYLGEDMRLVAYNDSMQLRFIRTVLPSVQSFYAAQDTIKHRIWVGTSQGVYLLDTHFRTIKQFAVSNGLAGNNIYGLLLDSAGNAWVSHQKGLSSIDARTFYIVNYDKADGIQGWDFNNRSFLKTRDGWLFFGGSNGFNYFKPPLYGKQFYAPKAYIEDIYINNKAYTLDKNPEYVNTLDLKPAENNIKLKVSVRDLGFSGTQLCYRLLSKDTTWILLDDNQDIQFSQLAGGTYTIEYGIYDKYTGLYQKQNQLEIKIATAFYKSRWFWSLIALGLGVFFVTMYFRYQARIVQRESDKRLLEEQQIKQITADLHDDIGATLSSLQVNSELALRTLSSDATKTSSLLQTIATQTQGISESLSDYIWSLRSSKEQFMTLSTRIKNYANDILGAKEMAFKFDFDAAIDSTISNPKQKKNCIMLIREAINNAAKYSGANAVNVELKIQDNLVHILIKDDGIGYDQTRIEERGIGNMKMRVKELYGQINIVSSVNQGTKIEVSFPLHPLI